jgi:hypothetical protein
MKALTRRGLVAQVVCGGILVLVLSVGASGQQAQQGAKEDSGKKQKPTVPEILGWLEDKVNAQKFAQNGTKLDNGKVMLALSTTSISDYEGCSISVRYQDTTQYDDKQSHTDETKHFNLEYMSPDTRVATKILCIPCKWQDVTGWELIGKDASGKDSLRLNFNDKELAVRATKALDDAILICGGKKTKEIY